MNNTYWAITGSECGPLYGCGASIEEAAMNAAVGLETSKEDIIEKIKNPRNGLFKYRVEPQLYHNYLFDKNVRYTIENGVLRNVNRLIKYSRPNILLDQYVANKIENIEEVLDSVKSAQTAETLGEVINQTYGLPKDNYESWLWVAWLKYERESKEHISLVIAYKIATKDFKVHC